MSTNATQRKILGARKRAPREGLAAASPVSTAAPVRPSLTTCRNHAADDLNWEPRWSGCLRHRVSRFAPGERRAPVSFRALRLAKFLATASLLVLVGCQRQPSNRVQGYIEGEFVYVASPLAGALQKLHVQRGAEVKVGDPLFELEDTMEKAARDQARAALVLSEAEFKRQEGLFRTGVSAAQELDRARSARDQDQQRLTQANWNFSQKFQRAPRAGLVFDTLYREGEWVAANRPVISLLPPQNVKLRAFVPQDRIGAIHAGDPVRVFVDGAAGPVAGKVSFVSPRAEYTPPVIYSRESRDKLVFLVEAVFEPAVAVKLHPGQPVDVEFASPR
jgi:HlyD family secretion protein